MKFEIDKPLLERFYRKDCTPEEAKAVYQWLQDPKNEAIVSSIMEERWQDVLDNATVNSYSLNSAYSNLEESENAKSGKLAQIMNPKSAFSWYKMAAAIVLLLVAGTTVFFWRKNNEPISVETPRAQWQVKETQKGQKLTFRLADGSMVTLNTESKLYYPVVFDSVERRVRLEGEAYFEVNKDPEHPFSVQSDDIVTTALGTAFNIHNPDSTNQIIVSLVHGKVSVDNTAGTSDTLNSQILLPGESAIYDKTEQSIQKGKFNILELTAWKDNLLILKNASIEQICSRLESWYDVEIDLTNKPGRDWTYTGEFKNESLENVLKGISFSKNITFSIDGKHVQITFK